MASVNIENVFQEMSTAVSAREDVIAQAKVDPDNQADMIKLQQEMHKWTLATQMQSNTLKTISDSIKSIISNVR